MRVDRGCHRAYPALDFTAVGGQHGHRGAGSQTGELDRTDLGAPLQSSLAYQPEQLSTCAHHGADRREAHRDDPTVGRAHFGVLQAQHLGGQPGLDRLDPGFGGQLGRQVLVDLLAAEDPGILQSAHPVGVGAGFLGVGAGFGHGGAGLRHVRLHRLGGEAGQHLATLHHVAHVDQHLSQSQAADFGANAGLLPGGHIAVGTEFDRQGAALGTGAGYGQGGSRCNWCRWHRWLRCSFGAAQPVSDGPGNSHGGQNECKRGREFGETHGGRVLGQIGVWTARDGGSAVYASVRLRASQEAG